MKIRKLIQLIVLFIIPFTISSIFVTAQGNYVISTKQDFVDYLLSEDADMYGSYILTDNLDFTTGTVEYNGITYDLDDSGLEVTPIGEKKNENGVYQDSFNNPFKGTFNGSGHVIKGLNIRSKAIDNEYVGLFGYNEGIISHLGLVDSTVDGGVYVGGISGYNIGLIVGCYNTSSITGIGSVGGITGINYGYIRNCYNTGFVGGATKIGGIVGHNSSVVTAVYDLGIISGQLTDEGIKEYGYIFGYNNSQGVIGYVEDDNGPYKFISSQQYSIAGAYYCSEYDFGVGYNVGYLKNNERHFDNVKTFAKTLNELKNLDTYDSGFKTAKTNIYPIGSPYSHRTTGFFIKVPSGNSNYPFPVVGTSEFTTKHHQENSLHTNGYAGVGTIYNPFIITDEKGLNEVRYSLTSAFKLGNNINLTQPFVPIGDEENSFKGILNGSGKRIGNLMINGSEKDYIGLFAFNSGIIHNISLEVNINTPNGSRVGGLAGFNNGQIREVYVKGNITGLNTVGGITGSNELGSIKNSFNQAEVNGVMDIGGISGYNSGLIENVYSRRVPTLLNNSPGNAGGIVGFNEDSKASGVINNGYHLATNQIGYQSSLARPFTDEKSHLTSEDDFSNATKFEGFDISVLNKGQVGKTVWAIEEGVNNNEVFLVKTPPIRIESIAIDYNSEIEVNDNLIPLFDEAKRLVLGSDIYLEQILVDLDSLLIINPDNSENKKIHWEITYQMPNDGRSDVVEIINNKIVGLSTGRAQLRLITDEGGKTVDLEVLVLGNVTDVFLVNKENGTHENLEDLVPNQITLENFTSLQLFAEILPATSPSSIIWSSSNEGIATVDRFGNIHLHYTGNPNNPVVNQKYTNEVSVVIRAASIDNLFVYDEVKIVITPSSRTTLDSGLKVYERGVNIPLSRSGNNFYFTDPHRLVRYDVEYLNLEFYPNYNQTYKIISSHATDADSLVDGKNVYISKGDLDINGYKNRTNTIEIVIISESGFEEIYTLEVTKELSSNKEIANLNVTYDHKTMLNYSYHNNTFKITSRIPFGTKTLYFNPILTNNSSVYTKSNFHKITFSLYNMTDEFEGYINLPNQSGTIIVQMKVTSEDKTIKVYDIEVTMGYSSLDSVDDLFIGQINEPNLLNFNPNNHEYEIDLPLRYLNNLLIRVSPTLDEVNNQASRVYIGVDQSRPVETNSILIDIMSGRTVMIYIQIQSEANYHLNNEVYNTYIVKLHSEASDEALLYKVELNNNEIIIEEGIDEYSFIFEKGLYTDLINNARLRITASPWSIQEVTYLSFQNYFTMQESIYNINLHQDFGYYQVPMFQAGTYRVKIKIIAQNNLDSHEYFLEITKEPSMNSQADYIDLKYQNNSILDTFLIPGNYEVFNYDLKTNTYTLINEINVLYEYDYLEIEPNIYRYAKYRINGNSRLYNSYEKGKVNLNTSLNEIMIEVISEDASSTTTYILKVIRSYNPHTIYKQEYYLQDFSGSYSLYETVSLTGIALTETTAIEKEFVGFTLNRDHFDTVSEAIILEDGSLVLKLYYTRNSYNFNIEENENGTVISESGLIKYGYSINLQAIANVGYEFIGWFDGDTLISKLDKFEYKMPARDVILEAKFTVKKYTIEYELNGGINSSLNKDLYTINDLNLVLYEPSKVGYYFGGWYINNDFTGNKITEITIDNINDYTLYAYWIVNENSSYRIEYYFENLEDRYELINIINLNGPTYSEVTIEPEEIAGFIFDIGNNLNNLSGIILEDGSLVLQLYYLRASFTLDLVNENITHGSITGPSGNILFDQEITIEAFAFSGYQFDGWYINNELVSEQLNYTFKMPANNLQLVAKFSIRTYHINYHLNGGINHLDNIEEYTIETSVIKLFSPTKTEHAFLGWYLTSDFSGQPIDEIMIIQLHDIDVYAKWIINTYEVKFVTNIFDSLDALILEYGQKIPQPTIANAGYYLVDWYLEEGFNTPWNFNEDTIQGNLILYAKWDVETYTISYDLDGGLLPEGFTNPLEYTIETEDFILIEPIKEGYTFMGWYESADFSGDVVVGIPQGSHGHLNLYARYMIETFEIIIQISGRGRVETNFGTIFENVLVVPYNSTFILTLIPDEEFMLDQIKINTEEYDLVTEVEFSQVKRNYLLEVVFVGAEPEILTLIPGSGYRSNVYSIDRSGSENLFLDYYISQPVKAIRECFVNSPDRIKFFNKNGVELGEDSILGTGYTIKLYRDNSYFEVIDEVEVVVLGDVNGDGYINIFDIQGVINHLTSVKALETRAQLIAANTAKSVYLNIFSIQELILHISQVKLLYG